MEVLVSEESCSRAATSMIPGSLLFFFKLEGRAAHLCQCIVPLVSIRVLYGTQFMRQELHGLLTRKEGCGQPCLALDLFAGGGGGGGGGGAPQ